MKLTLKDIKNFSAEDITDCELPKNYWEFKVIGLSYGIYGMNGGLFQDCKSGKFYKITKRNNNLFRIA